MTHLVLPLSTLYYEDPAYFDGRVLPLIGELEVRFFDRMPVPDGLPLHVHFDLGLAADDFEDRVRASGLFGFLDNYEVTRLSWDLGPAAGRNLSVFPVSRELSGKEVLERCRKRVYWLRQWFSGEILLENLPYYRTGLYENVCEPDFFRRALELLDSGLLLDLAHAVTAADNMGRDRNEYIAALPLERMAGVHLSKVRTNRWQTVDAHECPDFEEIDMLQEVLETSGRSDVGVTVEFYREKEQLALCYETLSARLHIEGAAEGALE